MKLTRTDKEKVLDELKGLFKNSSASVASNYSGLSTSDITDLRKKMSEKGIRLIVTKNTLVKKALENLKLEIDQEILDQPLIFAFGEDEVEVSKELHTFAKEHENLEILSGFVRQEKADKAMITTLALLPGRDELQAKLVGVVAGPLTGFVNVLQGNLRGLVSVLSQYQNKLNN